MARRTLFAAAWAKEEGSSKHGGRIDLPLAVDAADHLFLPTVAQLGGCDLSGGGLCEGGLLGGDLCEGSLLGGGLPIGNLPKYGFPIGDLSDWSPGSGVLTDRQLWLVR